jgi:hypothetical protein
MKTLMGWIVGVFALGLVAGSLYRSTAAESEPDRGSLESALRSAPSVDCGAGRQAVLAPIAADGGTTVQIKCVSTSPVRERVVAAAAPTLPPVVAASREEPAPVTSSSTSPSSETPRVPATADKSPRSVKDHALIIGGAAGAGAGIGAIAKGKKGAAVGAAIGGVAGTVYDVLTRNKN